MPTTITGTLASPKADGTTAPLASVTFYVSPSNNQGLRIQYGGSGAFIPVVQNTALDPPYQYGFAVTTDASGIYTFKLPLLAEIRSPDANLKWNITLPDGTVYSGPALSAAGPVSIEDLLQTYSWQQTQGLVLTAPLSGTIQRGTATVSGAATSATVLFQGGQMPSSSYQVFVDPGKDTATQAVPEHNVTNKTQLSFVVEFAPGFTGDFDWLAWGG